ncbi:hypothetical protein SH467x_001438 [Pirellulaceae bacterium SH467]
MKGLYLSLVVMTTLYVGAMRLPMANAQNNPLSVHAIAGQPYGVAQVVIPAGQVSETASVRLIVTNEESRVFFPAIDIVTTEPQPAPTPPPRIASERPRIGALVQRIRNAVNLAKEQIDPPEVVRVQFLFTGENPFTIQIAGDINTSVEVRPLAPGQTTPAENGRAPLNLEMLRQSWWDGYVAQAKTQIERSDYPSIVENYLIHMLGRRFGYPIPDLSRKPVKQQEPQQDPMPTIALVAGVESLRSELHRETLNQSPGLEQPMRPIPPPPRWTEIASPAVPEELAVEAIAYRIPPECFYIRFGSFANFLWFKQFGESRGGDLAQLAVLRGLNYQTNDRMERMLNAKTTMVGKLFGDSIISDMAIIGQDLYLQEGPTMGILFEAKNMALLRSSMEGDRKTALQQYRSRGIKLEEVDVEGKKISLLSTPDNQVRSFMVERDNYLLLTTSQSIAKRFLEVADGRPSLAHSDAFRFARFTMPLSNEYSVFAYLSSEFFRNLVSPQYQIELRRRLKAIASIEIAEMASRVANAEANALGSEREGSIDSLMRRGYLPNTFQSRVDGSQTLLFSGQWHDSLRGARGSFLPIADVPLLECSQEEFDDYQEQSHFYATRWQQTDPMMFGIRRFTDQDVPSVENLVVEGYIAPLGREKYGWISRLLGEPVQTEIELPRDDMIHVQVHLSGETPLGRPSPNHVLFAGVKDLDPPIPGETKGLLATLRVLKSIPGYVGTWPSPGYLDRLPFGLGGGAPDVYGFSRSLFGLWRWQGGGFSIVSFDRSILEQCLNWIRPVPAADYAQGRVFIGDLKNSRVSSFFNILSFRRAAQTSRGNLMLLDAMQEQLHIPTEEALRAAEQLLDAKLQCPLGGIYEPAKMASDGRLRYWISTAWDASVEKPRIEAGRSNPAYIGFDPEHAIPAPTYRVPWLDWFRGAHAHLTQLPERLVLISRISMERLPVTPTNSASSEESEKLPTMNLDLFNLPFQFFQGDKPSGKPANKDAPEAVPPVKAERKDF